MEVTMASFYDVFGTSAGAQTIRNYLDVVETVASNLGPRTMLSKDVVYETMAEVIRDGCSAGWIPETCQEKFYELARQFNRAADTMQLAGVAGTPEPAESLKPRQSTSAFEFHSDLLQLVLPLKRQLHAEMGDRDGPIGTLTWAETVKMAARALQYLQKGLSFNSVRSQVLFQVEAELWAWAADLGEGRISGSLGDGSAVYNPSADNPWSQAGG
jgi:hypothetical protein